MPFDLAKAQKLAETAVTLKNEFLKSANWRREQAIDYPDDKWNFEAVALLDRLANTVMKSTHVCLKHMPDSGRAMVCPEQRRKARCFAGLHSTGRRRPPANLSLSSSAK